MKKLEEYSNSLSTLTYFVNTTFIRSIIDDSKTENEEPFRFFYTILQKTNNALDTCGLLLANYSSRPHHVDSLIIILRSLITDCVIFRYLLFESQGEDEIEKLKVNIKAIYFDHIKHTLKNVESCFQEIHGLSESEVKETIAKAKSDKREYYDSEGKPTVKKFSTSVLTILNEMAKKIKDPAEIESIRSFYHFYDIYSKYEHPGEFSFRLIHQQYSEQTRLGLANDIVFVINRLIIPTMSSMLALWTDLYRENEKKYMGFCNKLAFDPKPLV